ncbi:MAG TPA: IS66 family transposase [Dehalococcoidia bacterium]|nr:IS66 family transposase [Dehalococcoidia bacterium]
MSPPEDTVSLNREELLALVAELQRQITALQEQMAQLTASNQALVAENEQLKRSGKRQAAPFSKGTRAQQPKRPGRKPGEGTFSFRQAPRPEEITELPVNVPVIQESCPACGGQLAEERVDFAYITELPPLPRPRVTQYRVWVCRCTGCGRQVRGEHPDLAPDQYGSTAHRVGRRAMAAAHALHYQVGIPVRKVPLVLGLLTGMKLTQGAISQDALRRAKGNVGQKYQELRAGVRDSPVVYTDDTGWTVAGENAHLMAFDTDQATVYQVRPRHRHQEVQEVVPRNYPGVMGTDRGRSYEDKSFRRVKQQKCLAHLQRTLSEVLAHKKGRARDLAERTQELLRLAARLWKEYHWGDWKEFDRWVPEVRLALSYHLRDRPLKDQDNQKLLRMLRRYHQRGDLLRFLEQPEVEPSNNRVERILRPAVIVRKVSLCSKTWSGAYAFAAFTSVIQTLLKKSTPSNVVEALANLFRAPRSQTAPA